MTTTSENQSATITDNLKGTRDALSVRRVFGEPYEADGVAIIPVARVAGGAGGGGGDDEEGSAGFGSGFGLGARPAGVYEIRDGVAVWKPAVDVNRIIKGAQVLGGIVAVCLTLVVLRRNR